MFTLAIRAFKRNSREVDRVNKGWADLEGVAATRRWTYERRSPGRATEYCGVGPMPGKGPGLTAWHYITGELRGRSFKCFEYRYTDPLPSSTQSGSRKLTYESVVLFPAARGDDVRPDGVLELMPLPQPWRRFMGAGKLPADLPVEAAGSLELRGPGDGLPMGVPWIEGQAYWPKHSYGPDDLMGQEGRALMARLLADATAEADAID
ncbi:hypothetical protein [Streptomyces sp. NPDC004685]